MKAELQNILNRINSFQLYNPSIFCEYQMLVKQCAEKLDAYKPDRSNPMLEAWLNAGLEEINKELQTRLSVGFSSLSPDKQKTEFMYSRSTVSLALTNIIMNL